MSGKDRVLLIGQLQRMIHILNRRADDEATLGPVDDVEQ